MATGSNHPGSVFFWKGLRSYVFHVSALSETDPRIRGLKSVLSHPDVCFTVEPLSGADASHVLEEDFKGMQHDIHSLRIGNMRIHDPRIRYAEDLSELDHSIKRGKKKLFRVKVLIDADRVDRRSAEEMLRRIRDLRDRD